MFSVVVLLTFAVVAISAGPAPTKQISHYENTILHKGPSPKLNHKIIPVQNSIGDNQLKKLFDEFNSYPEYEFAYGVRDPITGDHKDQWEKRVGDHVQGVYMFEEADGTQRIVEYEVDDVQGFRAKVTNVGQRQPEGSIKSSKLAHHHQGSTATSYNMLTKAN
ncbi:cuticle protein-like [Ochlerotatus camptorhynchus]|uniref:cuticle protein-like n=1 Tax=Ochlerotatus camptorhynchus TaxID=644619 RepID=UPI0031D894E3